MYKNKNDRWKIVMGRGFTLIEVLIMVAIVIILSVAASPFLESQRERANLGSMMTTLGSLNAAYISLYSDVGHLVEPSSVEFSERALTGPGFAEYKDGKSVAQVYGSRWSGPYIDSHIEGAENPFGTSEMHLKIIAVSPRDRTWVPEAGCTNDNISVHSVAMVLDIGKVTQSQANSLELSIDKGRSGANKNGKFCWDPATGHGHYLVGLN